MSDSNSMTPDDDSPLPGSSEAGEVSRPPGEAGDIVHLWAQVAKLAGGATVGARGEISAQNDSNIRLVSDSEHSEIGVRDWNALFSAVEERLILSVAQEPAITSPSQSAARAAHIRLVVTECVAALDKLHAALNAERCRHLPPKDEKLDSDLAAARRLTSQLLDDLKH